MSIQEFALEFTRTVVPPLVLYVQLLKTRTELDILYGKHRESNATFAGNYMRRRWYHVLKKKRKPIEEYDS